MLKGGWECVCKKHPINLVVSDNNAIFALEKGDGKMIDDRDMEIIDEKLLNVVTEQAKASPRLRKNYNFHMSLDEKCHRFLNALEPGTVMPIHHHPTKDETYVILRGRVRVMTYHDDGTMIESVVLCQKDGVYGVNIPKGTWHTVESLESDSCIFESKEGPFVPHEEEGVLQLTR